MDVECREEANHRDKVDQRAPPHPLREEALPNAHKVDRDARVDEDDVELVLQEAKEQR